MFTESYKYAGGYFGKLQNSSPGRWNEGKTDSAEAWYFEELKRDGQGVLLRDAGRGMTILIPLAGGESRFSTDDGATWQRLSTCGRSELTTICHHRSSGRAASDIGG